jgi:hypothetical protein
VKRLQVELFSGLCPTNFIVGRCTASAIASCIPKIVLLSLRLGAHILRRHQSRIVPKRFETEVMPADTSLNADQATRHIGQPCFDPASRPLLRSTMTPVDPNQRNEMSSCRYRCCPAKD